MGVAHLDLCPHFLNQSEMRKEKHLPLNSTQIVLELLKNWILDLQAIIELISGWKLDVGLLMKDLWRFLDFEFRHFLQTDSEAK